MAVQVYQLSPDLDHLLPVDCKIKKTMKLLIVSCLTKKIQFHLAKLRNREGSGVSQNGRSRSASRCQADHSRLQMKKNYLEKKNDFFADFLNIPEV